MAIRTILVPLYGNGVDGRSLAAASDLAHHTQAHLTAIYCDSDPADLLASLGAGEGQPYFSDTLVRSLLERAEGRRAAAERSFSQWLPHSGVAFGVHPTVSTKASAEFVIAVGKVQSLVRDYAIAADLTVVSMGAADDLDRAAALEAILFDAGRPVLAVPPAASETIFVPPVAIAWNYSVEAARALNAALPIIEAVGEAVVLQAGHHEDDASARRIVAFLDWHGVKAHAIKLGQAGKPAELIAAKIVELGSKLLVMGAYSHTRAREFVFGGMTSFMMEHAPVALLLTH